MSTELLYACPLCYRTGFSARGLKAHWCDGTSLPRRRLRATEIACARVCSPAPTLKPLRATPVIRREQGGAS